MMDERDWEAVLAAREGQERAALRAAERDRVEEQRETARAKLAIEWEKQQVAKIRARAERMQSAPSASDASTRPLAETVGQFRVRSGVRYLWHGFEARMCEDSSAGLGASDPAATVAPVKDPNPVVHGALCSFVCSHNPSP